MSRLDPWKILGIHSTKDQSKIEQAWRRLAAQHHPDRGGDPALFRQAREAYELALKLRSSVIPITRVKSPIKINLILGRSQVLHASVCTVEWQDQNHKSHLCELDVPVWHECWGSQRTLVIQDASTQTLIHFNVQLEDDDIVESSGRLVWQPAVDILPVIKSRSLTASVNNCTHTVNIDDYGAGVLESQGYLNEEGERSDILVRPRYLWPKKQDDET